MKRKLLYKYPLTEEVDLTLEGACLYVTSDVTTDTDNPMPWDEGNN